MRNNIRKKLKKKLKRRSAFLYDDVNFVVLHKEKVGEYEHGKKMYYRVRTVRGQSWDVKTSESKGGANSINYLFPSGNS